jgi:hypothetical protein
MSMAGCANKTKRNMQPEITTTDSAVVMYYHTPGNPKFFDMIKVYDKNIISLISKNINDKVIPPKDTCTTQGKIYFYGQKGAVYVVYFSRLDDCKTLSLIKTGEKYFMKMNEDIKEILDDMQKNAKEPQAQVH